MPLSLIGAVALVLQVTVTTADTAGARSVCMGPGCRDDDAPKRIPVTAQHLATAFRDTTARSLLLRAREARLRQDSAMISYEVTAYQRISAGLKAAAVGRERLIFRNETASHVRWHRDRGAFIEIKGARTVHPAFDDEDRDEDMLDDLPDMTVLPYRPGGEQLWIGGSRVEAEVDEDELVHPLAEGSEAYYTYESGDAAGFRLPDGREIRLRELKVRPRIPRWNVVVGSLWFDVDRGQLVRAAYRLSEPMNVYAEATRDDPEDMKDVPLPIRQFLKSMRGQISAIAVEYSLHEGRFWMPRLQSVEGQGQAGFLRVPFSMEQRFRYTSVNAEVLDTLPRLAPPQWVVEQRMLDSLPPDERKRWRDSTRAVRRAASRARADSIKQGLLADVAACDTGSVHVARGTRGEIPVVVRVPCDAKALASSPELPGSIYGDGEEVFDREARDALIAQAISLGAQPSFGIQKPEIDYGLPWTRFNRIEGLSIGAHVSQRFGAGYAGDATLRFGVADREPNVELGLARTDLTNTIRLGAYNRLVSVGDWGNPLSFGSSLSALLWGRDDGFYHRATGIDLTGTREHGATLTWRLFGERQRTANADNEFSFAKLLRDAAFPPNIVSERGTWGGGSVRAVRTLGLNPRGWRLLGDVRLEGAGGAIDTGGTASYGRMATDMTLSRALGPARSNVPLAAITVSGGTTLGDVPPQRMWYLGGTHTVRGQPPGTSVGDAYWFGRLELGQEVSVARVSVFGDAGWAGSRDAFSSTRAISGAGVGVGLLDGLLRLDVAKGIHPFKSVRTDLYLEARF